MTSDRVVSELMTPLWEAVLWPFLVASDRVCICAKPPRNGMCKGDAGRTASSASSF